MRSSANATNNINDEASTRQIWPNRVDFWLKGPDLGHNTFQMQLES